jgi:ribosome biogenesis GTPase / thiamine phosphate phosphatase
VTTRGPVPRDAATLADGRVVESHGQQLVVEDAAGQRVACRLHGRKLAAVCGDEVRWGHAAADDGQGLVYELKPRRATLERLATNGRSEPVVANLSQLVVVVAPLPAPDWFVVDRYLAGAAWCGIGSLIACNKSELAAAPQIARELAVYAAIGYPIVHTSARAAPGIAALAARLKGAISVLVGQSGTGKSSLLNALVPEARAVTQEISAASEEGRHTTTTAVLHRLASGGDLIDSPGVRDYAPPLPAMREVASGFVEIARAAAGCRFQDCLHSAEPGCAVRAAVAAGAIHPRRFESFRRLLDMARELGARHPARRPARRSRRLR